MKYARTIIGYHGCDLVTAEEVLAGGAFKKSQNVWDWLGEGTYFWEFGSDRALRFAEFQKSRGKVVTPTVVGAVIQLGECFDLMDTKYTAELAEAYTFFKRARSKAKDPLPKNRGKTPEKELRHLDCAVLNFYLRALEEAGERFDSVRCAFLEGEPAFPGSGIRQQNHIQIAVRNPACVVGVFRPQ